MLKETGNTNILQKLLNDKIYKKCLKKIGARYQLREQDINSCFGVLYHELSKHAHGNTSELVVSSTEHTITEVAAMEAIFCALKEHNCFHLPIKFRVG